MKHLLYGILTIFGIGLIVLGFFFFNWQRIKNIPIEKAPAVEAEIAKPEVAPPKNIKKTSFLFSGDMMFDRYVNHMYKDKGFDQIFSNLDKAVFANKNISFANLEGPVSEKPIIDDYPERSLSFNMPPETIATIKNLGLNGVSLANNHTLNAGENGFVTTKKLLDEAGLKYGGSQNGFSEESIIRYETEIPVSIIAIDYLAYNKVAVIAEAIKKEKEAGRFVVVFPHWGEEYALTHSASQRSAAVSFIDAGASLIVGGHPHVVQDVEIINNVPVFYSLGNFVFDQTFSKDTQEGLILTGTISENKTTVEIHPFKSEKMIIRMMDEQDKAIMLKRINKGQNTIDLVLEN